MTTKERARWEEMRKAVDDSRIDEATAKDFMERLRGSLARSDSSGVSDVDVKRVREKIKDAIEKSGYVGRMEAKLAKEAQRRKGKYIN